jgi:peptidoglycan L-alanyl-D-glutamate endopeptidase CwlK
MASRDLNDLHPTLKALAIKFLDECKARGYDILVTCTYRSTEEQNKLYEQGRSNPGKIVTYVKGGKSKHNATIGGLPASRAFDIVPMENGKPNWSNLEAFRRIGEIGKSIGLVWGGDWTKFKDMPHFELPKTNQA